MLLGFLLSCLIQVLMVQQLSSNCVPSGSVPFFPDRVLPDRVFHLFFPYLTLLTKENRRYNEDPYYLK